MRIAILLLVPALVFPQIVNFQWPLASVDVQHRISATFDECREDRDHFHNGTDIPLTWGGAVLASEGGTVTGMERSGGNAYIRVGRFAYVHVDPHPALSVGATVVTGAVVGWTNDQGHIHLNDGGGSSNYSYGNAILPGHLEPFQDSYKPRSPLISFHPDGSTQRFTGNRLSGRVDIWAQAADTTDLASSIDMNNGVYSISWALLNAAGDSTLEAHANFRAQSKYSDSYIKFTYAPGSSTSLYIFNLTNPITRNGYLDCEAYPEGAYLLQVVSRTTSNQVERIPKVQQLL